MERNYVTVTYMYWRQNSTVAGATAAGRTGYDADSSSPDDVKSAVEVRDEGQHPNKVHVSHVVCNSGAREHAGQAGTCSTRCRIGRTNYSVCRIYHYSLLLLLLM